MTTVKKVLEFLKLQLEPGMGPNEVFKLMKPYEIGSMWVYLGGSGARQLIFQLKDKIGTVFLFDGKDSLIAYGVYESEELLEDRNRDLKISPVPDDIVLNYINQP